MREATALLEASGLTDTELAERLSAVAHRNPVWDRTVVADFKRDGRSSIAFMRALLDLFGDELLPPMFMARSYKEAHKLSIVASKFPEILQRRAELETVVEAMDAKTASDVRSEDGQGGDHGGSDEPSGDRPKRGVVPRGARTSRVRS